MAPYHRRILIATCADMLLILKKMLATLVLPPVSTLLLAAYGVWLSARRPRLGRTLAWFGLGLTLLLTVPLVGTWLRAQVDYWPALDLNEAKKAQAIVVLSGGSYYLAPEYGGDTIRSDTLERTRYAAVLSRQTGLPLLVTGGGAPGHKSDAESMRDVLVRDFGVQVRWVEGVSADTRENAVNSAIILEREGVKRIVLVTSAYHMHRSIGEFRRVGLEVTPAPTVYATFSRDWPGTLEYLPHPEGFERSWWALHELLGRAAQRLRLF